MKLGKESCESHQPENHQSETAHGDAPELTLEELHRSVSDIVVQLDDNADRFGEQQESVGDGQLDDNADRFGEQQESVGDEQQKGVAKLYGDVVGTCKAAEQFLARVESGVSMDDVSRELREEADVSDSVAAKIGTSLYEVTQGPEALREELIKIKGAIEKVQEDVEKATNVSDDKEDAMSALAHALDSVKVILNKLQIRLQGKIFTTNPEE